MVSDYNTVIDAESGVANGESLIVDGTESGRGALTLSEIGGTADAEIYREVDSNDDGSFDVSVLIDSTTGAWHSQLNELNCTEDGRTRLRIENVSGSAADFYAVGTETVDVN
jgi:hypothetical protein